MPSKSCQTNGGIAKAAKIRAEYISNPNLCLFCQSAILPQPGKVLTDTRKQKFCNRSCAAKYNNRRFPKRSCATSPTGLCATCTTVIHYKKGKDGTYSVRRYCEPCSKIARYAARNFSTEALHQRTKGDLFATRKNWQSARSTIVRHAALMFRSSGKPNVCVICGYAKHIDICHINDVASFPDSATIGEINASSNLVALCPNHHWEYDNGLIILVE